MHYIAVFRSLTDTHAFNNLLKSYGICSFVINTPRQAEVSCGLCVKISYNNLKEAKELIKRRNFASFVGIFFVQNLGNGQAKVNKIVV